MVTTTTDFDSGGAVSLDVDDTNDHIEITHDDEHGYDDPLMHFRVDDAEGVNISFTVTDLADRRMPSEYRMYYSDTSTPGGWKRFDGTVGGGWSHTFDDDTVYVASWLPYPYQSAIDLINQATASPYGETEVIGRSAEEKLDMHAIRLMGDGVDPSNAEHITAMARQHPGESLGSYHLEAGFNWILDRLESGDFTEQYVFHFLPTVNPDGIYNAYHRHDSQGNDFNREWDTAGPPELDAIRDYISQTVGSPHWGFDHHCGTGATYTAVFYEEYAAGADDVELIEELESINHSYEGRGPTNYPNRGRSFYYETVRGVMATTEVWTLHGYTETMLTTEGERFYSTVMNPAQSPE